MINWCESMVPTIAISSIVLQDSAYRNQRQEVHATPQHYRRVRGLPGLLRGAEVIASTGDVLASASLAEPERQVRDVAHDAAWPVGTEVCDAFA